MVLNYITHFFKAPYLLYKKVYHYFKHPEYNNNNSPSYSISQSQYQSLVKQHQELTQKYKNITERHQTLVKEIQYLNNQCTLNSQNYTALKTEYEKIQEDNKRLLEENARLNDFKALSKLAQNTPKVSQNEHDKLKKQLSQLEGEHKKVLTDNTYLRDENKKLTEDIENTRITLDAKRKELAFATQHVKSNQETQKILQEEYTTLKAKKEELLAEYQKVQDDYKKVCIEYTTAEDKSKAEILELNNMIHELKEDAVQKAKEYMDMQEKLKTFTKECKRLTETNEDLEASWASQKGLHEQIIARPDNEARKELITQHTTTVNEKDEQIDKLQKGIRVIYNNDVQVNEKIIQGFNKCYKGYIT